MCRPGEDTAVHHRGTIKYTRAHFSYKIEELWWLNLIVLLGFATEPWGRIVKAQNGKCRLDVGSTCFFCSCNVRLNSFPCFTASASLRMSADIELAISEKHRPHGVVTAWKTMFQENPGKRICSCFLSIKLNSTKNMDYCWNSHFFRVFLTS